MKRRAFLPALGGALQLRGQSDAERPNIVFILTDDLGLADLGCYGAKDIRTPVIDRLAAEGVKFTQAYANGPLCSPTRAALMTGRYQQRVGIEYAWTPRDMGKGLAPSESALPKLLKAAGYRTGIFGKWHLGGDDQFSPTQHGFDEFFGFRGSDHDYYTHRRIDGDPDLWDGLKPAAVNGYSTDLFTDRAVHFLRNATSQPFFLYLAFNSPHWPFQAPGRPTDLRRRETWFDGTRSDYVRMVESVDAAVGRVLDELKSRQLAGNTLVIFTNDNGGERLSDNRPAFHHKMTLWEGGVRVPAIMRWPGRIKGGTLSPQVAITMDFTATMLACAGAKVPPDRPLEGIDLMPLVNRRSPPVSRTLFWRYVHPPLTQRSVLQGNWKYLKDGIHDLLFDLASDPAERHDLAYRHPAKVNELKALLAKWEADVESSKPQFQIR